MEKALFILLFMIFLHIVEDFHLQGIIASMKQKSWWGEQQGYSDFYKNDYVIALLAHSFSWTFMIMLPILYTYNYKLNIFLFIIFICNFITHAIIDNLKANKKKINLISDQIGHLIQIIITWLGCIVSLTI